MSEPLRVDPHVLDQSGKSTVDHAHDAFQKMTSHDNGLADAASGWVGSSATALAELAERWQTRHSQHLEDTRELGERMSIAGRVYHNSDRDAAETITHATDSTLPTDMGL